MTEQEEIAFEIWREEFIKRAGFRHTWRDLESWARRMVEQAYVEHCQADLEALREDAARYRWLRQQHWNESELAVVRYPKDAVKLGHDCPSLERLDRLIDERINDALRPL